MEKELIIEAIGSNGDGIAQSEGEKEYVPYTLPGESVKVEHIRGKTRLIEILKPSPERREPPCPYFGKCGGCAIQHWKEERYENWKKELVDTALKHRGIEINVEKLVSTPIHNRQRVSLSYENYKEKIKVGFFERQSHHLVDIEECILLPKEINNLIKPLKELLGRITQNKDHGHFLLTKTQTGIDIAIHFHKRKKGLGLEEREAIAAFAQKYQIACITHGGKEILIERIKSYIIKENFKIKFPSNTFLQPSKEGEEALIKGMTETLNEKEYLNIADLFCGLGSFTIPLMHYGRVTGYDNAGPAIKALRQAIQETKQESKVNVYERDLFTLPLTTNELKGFDVVVLDPPRAGAQEQSKNLSQSKIPKIIYVSCDPGTFARDARFLIDGGYELKKVTPVDQFPFTAHVEVIGLFEKKH